MSIGVRPVLIFGRLRSSESQWAGTQEKGTTLSCCPSRVDFRQHSESESCWLASGKNFVG